jgi:hypothetical protein
MKARSTKRVRVRIRVRTTFVMTIATLAGALYPAPAGAAPPGIASLRVAQSQDSVLDYWTDDRMENAQPAEVEDETGSTAPSTVPKTSGEPQAFEGTTPPLQLHRSGSQAKEQAPVPTEGKIFFTGTDGFDYMCSGTAVISDNESTVWTAGHCVHGGGGQGYHHNWIFVPGYDDGEAPFGVWTAESLSTPTAWARYSSLKYDVGAAVVAPSPDGTTLGDTVGMEGIAFNQPAFQFWTSLGYPAGRPFDGSDLYACNSRTLGRHNPDRLKGQRTLFIRCDMNGGSSGGGWFFTFDGNRYVGSLNSYGVVGYRYRMYGPYQGPAALALWRSVQGT